MEKRRFINLLNNFGWNRLASRVLDNVQDVENYSLSEKATLLKNVMTDQSKTAQYSFNDEGKKNKSNKGGKQEWNS